MEKLDCDIVITYHTKTIPYLREAIDSIVNQEGVRCAIHLVADNVSEEADSHIIEYYRNLPDMFFYRNTQSIGPFASVNRIFPHLKTEYFAIQDSDDIAEPNRIILSLYEMKTKNADIFSGSIENFIDPLDVHSVTLQKEADTTKIILAGSLSTAYPYGRIINTAMVVKKEAFKQLNGFANWFCGADAEFAGRAHVAGVKICYSDTVIIRRRLRKESLSNGEEYGMGSPIRHKINHELQKRFLEFTPGFDHKKYGNLDEVLAPKEASQSLVSACIVSWKRPSNVKAIVKALRLQPLIDDIVIWNNNADVTFNFEDERVTVINSPKNIKTYGRFLATKATKHECIYTQDDDCIVDNIAEIFKYYEKDQSCIVYNLQPRHFVRKDDDMHNKAQMALVGWGAIFNREWVSGLNEYIKEYGMDEILFSEADRIFSLLMNRNHKALLSNVHHLEGAHNEEAMWRRHNHEEMKKIAVERSVSLLGIMETEDLALSR